MVRVMGAPTDLVAYMRGVNKYVIRGLSLDFGRGAYVLVGPNGSGKTTILRLLAGAIAPELGEVRVLGRDPYRDYKVRGAINYVASSLMADWLERPVDYLSVYYRLTPPEYRRLSPLEALREMGLAGREAARVYSLSEGQRRRVELAKLLVRSCPVVLVDEPTVFLDDESRRRVLGLLRDSLNRGRLLVAASHDKGLIESLKARVIVVEGGKVKRVYGTDEARDYLNESDVLVARGIIATSRLEELLRLSLSGPAKRIAFKPRIGQLLERLGVAKKAFKGSAMIVTVSDPSELRRLFGSDVEIAVVNAEDEVVEVEFDAEVGGWDELTALLDSLARLGDVLEVSVSRRKEIKP